MRSLITIFAAAIFTTGGLACGSSNNNTKNDAAVVPIDAPATGGPDASCFTLGSGSATNDEIINACTTAQKIYLTPNLPLLVDGGLPSLPE
jgi:hypothetical protein